MCEKKKKRKTGGLDKNLRPKHGSEKVSALPVGVPVLKIPRYLLGESHVSRNCLCSFTEWEYMREGWCESSVGPKVWQKEVASHLCSLQQVLLMGEQALPWALSIATNTLENPR